MPVGEVFLSSFLQVLFDRLAPRDLSFFPRPEVVLPELQKWKKKLLKMEAVLADAEEKQLTDKLVKMWLDELRDLAYDLEDLLDEFSTEELERKLMAEQNHYSSSLLEDAGRAFMSYTGISGIKSKMDDISCRLDQLWEEKQELGLIKRIDGSGTSSSSSTSTSAYQRPQTTSVTTELSVYGRDEDAAKLLEMVLSDHESSTVDTNFRVISIVGMGGIGKTTLARKVYNDTAVKDFNPKVWVCVSDDFDVFRISKAILESITGRSCDLKDLNAVHVQLEREVTGRKFLLVLDDVWSKNYSYWEILRSPFLTGARGSRIIVTTRILEVALTTNPSGFYELKLLSNDDCWSLFVRHAFECRDISTYSNMDLIRQKVVEKCRGLPLAAKTLGGLLRSKQREDEFSDMLNSKLWDLSNESEIPAVLKLSYYYLPSHLKRCFAYCAIFPKDYEFKEEELVLLWMAEGLIQQSTENKQPEDLGCQYFRDLCSRSIFQRSSNDGSKFVMHELLHDLSQWVFREITLRLEDVSCVNKQLQEFEKVRHFSYTSNYFDCKKKFEVFQEAECLRARIRTFLPIIQDDFNPRYITNMVLSDLLPKLKKLRALSLRTYYITELPNSIGGLIHLRYLNLSRTKIQNLPESTSSFYNLQILMLRDCSCLKKLPSKFRNLIKLRYLDIRGAHLIQGMPYGMKELTSLRILSNFIVGKGIESTLEDLKKLKFLRGELCISRLENVIDVDLGDSVLRDKENLKGLLLEWTSQFDDSRKEVIEENVLDLLRPHQNLEMVTIKCYGGTRFPSWVGDSSFSKMMVLRLENCEKCTSLPSLGLLSMLKDLRIEGMKKLESVGPEIYGEGCVKPFQSLKTLCFENLQEWKHWEPIEEHEHGKTFPCLGKLSIVNCPKLSGRLPNRLPSLKELMIRHCELLTVSFSSLPMLRELELDGFKMMASNSTTPIDSGNWLRKGYFQKVERLNIKNVGGGPLMLNDICIEKPPLVLQTLTSLRELCIENCSNLISFSEVCFLSNLSKLEVINCKVGSLLPEEKMLNNANLASLKIEGCHSVQFILRGQLPSSLKRLEIKNCQDLECLLDDREEGSTSSSVLHGASLLEYLYVSDCPSLTSLSSSGQLPETLRTLIVTYNSKLESIAERFHNNLSLEYIHISTCENLKSIPEGLHNLTSLRKYKILDCDSIVCFPQGGFPLTDLSIEIVRCKELRALPSSFHNLTSLQELDIWKCPSISSFPEEGFPTNLTRLLIKDNLRIYKSLARWGLHKFTSLTSLIIGGCPDAESFPQEEIGMILPHSLVLLNIQDFKNLKYLCSQGFQNLTSLERLYILYCPKLTSFPEQGLPSSLLQLYINDCPLLKEECERDIGKEWSNISHIPYVQIDGRFIYDPNE